MTRGYFKRAAIQRWRKRSCLSLKLAEPSILTSKIHLCTGTSSSLSLGRHTSARTFALRLHVALTKSRGLQVTLLSRTHSLSKHTHTHTYTYTYTVTRTYVHVYAEAGLVPSRSHPSRFVEPRLSISLALAVPLLSSSSSALLLARCAWSSLGRALRISSWHKSTSDSSPLSFHPPLGGSSKPSRPSACSSHPLLLRALLQALFALLLSLFSLSLLFPLSSSSSTSVRFLLALFLSLSLFPLSFRLSRPLSSPRSTCSPLPRTE